MTFLYYTFLFLFLFTCVVLCLIILAQESKSTGLGASFGGGDSGESLFGASTPEVLKKITAWISFLFMAGCIFLSFWTGAMGRATTKSDYNATQIER